MVSHVTITTIQRLAHLKRGPCHSLSSVRHRGSVLQFHQGGCKRAVAFFTPTGHHPPPVLLFPFWYSPVEICCHPVLQTEH